MISEASLHATDWLASHPTQPQASAPGRSGKHTAATPLHQAWFCHPRPRPLILQSGPEHASISSKSERRAQADSTAYIDEALLAPVVTTCLPSLSCSTRDLDAKQADTITPCVSLSAGLTTTGTNSTSSHQVVWAQPSPRAPFRQAPTTASPTLPPTTLKHLTADVPALEAFGSERGDPVAGAERLSSASCPISSRSATGVSHTSSGSQAPSLNSSLSQISSTTHSAVSKVKAAVGSMRSTASGNLMQCSSSVSCQLERDSHSSLRAEQSVQTGSPRGLAHQASGGRRVSSHIATGAMISGRESVIAAPLVAASDSSGLDFADLHDLASGEHVEPTDQSMESPTHTDNLAQRLRTSYAASLAAALAATAAARSSGGCLASGSAAEATASPRGLQRNRSLPTPTSCHEGLEGEDMAAGLWQSRYLGRSRGSCPWITTTMLPRDVPALGPTSSSGGALKAPLVPATLPGKKRSSVSPVTDVHQQLQAPPGHAGSTAAAATTAGAAGGAMHMEDSEDEPDVHSSPLTRFTATTPPGGCMNGERLTRLQWEALLISNNSYTLMQQLSPTRNRCGGDHGELLSLPSSPQHAVYNTTARFVVPPALPGSGTDCVDGLDTGIIMTSSMAQQREVDKLLTSAELPPSALLPTEVPVVHDAEDMDCGGPCCAHKRKPQPPPQQLALQPAPAQQARHDRKQSNDSSRQTSQQQPIQHHLPAPQATVVPSPPATQSQQTTLRPLPTPQQPRATTPSDLTQTAARQMQHPSRGRLRNEPEASAKLQPAFSPNSPIFHPRRSLTQPASLLSQSPAAALPPKLGPTPLAWSETVIKAEDMARSIGAWELPSGIPELVAPQAVYLAGAERSSAPPALIRVNGNSAHPHTNSMQAASPAGAGAKTMCMHSTTPHSDSSSNSSGGGGAADTAIIVSSRSAHGFVMDALLEPVTWTSTPSTPLSAAAARGRKPSFLRSTAPHTLHGVLEPWPAMGVDSVRNCHPCGKDAAAGLAAPPLVSETVAMSSLSGRAAGSKQRSSTTSLSSVQRTSLLQTNERIFQSRNGTSGQNDASMHVRNSGHMSGTKMTKTSSISSDVWATKCAALSSDCNRGTYTASFKSLQGHAMLEFALEHAIADAATNTALDQQKQAVTPRARPQSAARRTPHNAAAGPALDGCSPVGLVELGVIRADSMTQEKSSYVPPPSVQKLSLRKRVIGWLAFANSTASTDTVVLTS